MKKALLIGLLFITSIGGAKVKVSVTVSDNKFTPKIVTINVGDTIEWTNVGGAHNINGNQSSYPSNPESFGNSNGFGWVYSYVFTLTGAYDYNSNLGVPFGMVGRVNVQVPVGIDEQVDINKIGFYPNPASKELFFSEYGKIKNVAIYALTGKEVMKTTLLTKKLDVSVLNSGAYFVKITTNGDELTKKLIIQ